MTDNLLNIFQIDSLSLAPNTSNDEAKSVAIKDESSHDLDPDVDSYEISYSSLYKPDEFEQNDVRVAMIGNVDSGKSTLIGVLTSSSLDDGRGAARSFILKHRHEQENGRTSAVTLEIIVNYSYMN